MNTSHLLRSLPLRIFLSCNLALWLLGGVDAATFNVPDGDVATLKNAITLANSNGQSDIINLAPNGTYTLTTVENLIDGPSGLPQIANDAAGLDLTINGNGATIQRSADPGTPEFRILEVMSGAALSCDSLTIANGRLTGSFPAERGAGILLHQATLMLTNCMLRDHVAQLGAAIYSSASEVTLKDSTISANHARAGGGIYNIAGTITASGSTFSANDAQASAGSYAFGGAIYSRAENGPAAIALTDCTLLGNRILGTGEGKGGAIYSAQTSGAASLNLTNCLVEANSGEGATSGGAIANESGEVSLTSCTLRGNYAREGGALHSYAGPVQVRHSSFEKNYAVIDSTTAGGSGGAIYLSPGTLTLLDTTLLENAAGKAGGGIYSTGTVTITDSDLQDNAAAFEGGAIADFGALKLVDSRVDQNSANRGGGIYTRVSATLQRCTVTGNTANAGGAVFSTGELAVETSTFDNNEAVGVPGQGGAIGSSKEDFPLKTTVRDSTLSNNRAERGGAISNVGELTLLGSTLSANTATAEGGGVLNRDGNSLIAAATFYGNSSPSGGGIYNLKTTASDSTVTVLSTILQRGASGANIVNASGTFFSSGYNLSSDAAGGDGSTGPGGLLNNSEDVRNTNPNLGPLQNNGGPTQTHALLFPSAAINGGGDWIQNLPFRIKNDQRGPGFPRQIGERVDKGALESGVSLVVTTIDDHDDGACTPVDCTLREAITAVNGAGIGNVSFAAGVTGTIQLSGALPDVSANLVLQGPGAELLTVRRNSGGDYRIFTLNNGTTSGPHVSISGLTISNGHAPAGSFPGNSGGGIFNERGVLTVSRSVVTGNRAAGDSSYGGGIFNEEGTLVLRESTISDNVAERGGGIASLQAYPGLAWVFVVNSTLNGNTAEHGKGGGIYNEATNASTTANVSVSNSTVSGNSATATGFIGGIGGAIYNAATNSGKAEVSLADCTISGNNAPNTGGIYNNNAAATARVALLNSILKNGASGNFLNSNGEITSLGHNLADDAAGGLSGTGPGGYLSATGDVRETDALLGPLQNNGGPTATHALLEGSPAINTGSDVFASYEDQRGYVRVSTNDKGAFEVGGTPPVPPAPVSVVSRKTHGSAGTFDVDLLASPSRTESRSGGAAKAYQIVVTFANDIALSDFALSSSDNVAAAAVSVSGKAITIDVTQVTNAQAMSITLLNVTDEINTGDITIPFRVLLGDSNGDGIVNSGDAQQTRNRSGQAIDTTNFRSDFNLDGTINSGDATVVRSRSGQSIP